MCLITLLLQPKSWQGHLRSSSATRIQLQSLMQQSKAGLWLACPGMQVSAAISGVQVLSLASPGSNVRHRGKQGLN